MKTKDANKREKGENPSVKKLNRKLMAVSIGSWVIGLTISILYMLIIYHLHNDMTTTFENYIKGNDLLNRTAWFCGISMAVSAVTIVASFFFMYRALIK